MTNHRKHMTDVEKWSPEKQAERLAKVQENQRRYRARHREALNARMMERRRLEKLTITPDERETERLRSAAYHKEYRARNSELLRAKKKAYYATPKGREERRLSSERLHRRRGMLPRSKMPPEMAQERNRASWTKYRKSHAHVRRARFAERMKTDMNYRLGKSLRGRVSDFLRGKDKSQSTMALLGCTLEELKAHLEKQFAPWMNWTNYGRKGWTLDHRVACTLYNLSDPEQQAACFNFRNLQPMHHIENIRKGNKLPPGVPHPNPPSGVVP